MKLKRQLLTVGIALGAVSFAPQPGAQGVTFAIQRFAIEGNSLLGGTELDALVAPFTGSGRGYADIQKALEAIENAYRQKGYGAVNVHVPEQEVTSGTVHLKVVEAVIGKLHLSGNAYFDDNNIRSSLPALQAGRIPNLKNISENVQLANENPAKQVEVMLSTGESPGVIDARLKVNEHDPRRFFLTLDNTGTNETGRHRLGLAWQNANLLGGDEVLTLAYTGSPDVWLDHPDNVKVDIYSLAFHKPFYSLGDSIDVIYGNSNVNVPTVQNTGFGLNGKGEVAAVRWNHHFPRDGEYTSKLVFGYDYKFLNTTCSPDQRGLTATCTPYTVQPLSVTYHGAVQGIDIQAGYQVGLAMNLLPVGARYTGAPGTAAAGKHDRYSFLTGRPVSDEFMTLRFGGNVAQRFSGWMLRAALEGQLSGSAVPPSEQLGLVGSTAVRGFNERAITADQGYVANLELYTPSLASYIRASGNLHGVVFYDFAHGRNEGSVVAPTFKTMGVAAAGVGLRYALGKDVSFSWDAAQVIDPGPATLERRGDWRSHFKLTIAF